MKIALVIEQFNPQGGGAERSTAQIVQELVHRGHQVTLLAGVCPPGALAQGATLRPSGLTHFRTAGQLFRFACWARHELDTGGYDVSLSVTMTVAAAIVQPRSGTVRETLLRNLAIRRNWFTRGGKRLLNLLSPKQQALLALERRTIASPAVRCFAAHSQYVVRQLQHYQVQAERIELIPNAATMPSFDPAQRQRARQVMRQGLNIADDATMYLFAALNPRLKGVEPLLAAAALLKQRGGRFVLVLAGGAGYRQIRQAARLGIRDHVRFLPPTQKMADLYCAADVTVLPTYYDPASKVVIESLMMGTPAISTAYNGASDMIQGPGGSWRGRVVAEPDDVPGLAQAMAELADPAQQQRCRQAMAGLDTQFSMARHVADLEKLLERVAGTAPSGPRAISA